MPITHADVISYYRGARIALHFVEARRGSGQRFGAAADARFRAFAGSVREATLGAAARLDLLIRDADAEWPGALGARTVFALRDLAEDEPFGPAWPGLDGEQGEGLWREPPPNVRVAGDAFAALAALWGFRLTPVEVPAIDAADRIMVAGPSAIASLAQVFAGEASLDWAAQVTCVATPVAHRQLAGFAGVMADIKKPARVIAGRELQPVAEGVRFLVSDDAAAEDRAALTREG